MKRNYLSLILLLFVSLILVGCNKKKTETPYLNNETKEYTFTSDYIVKEDDITNFTSDISIDLGGYTFDLNGKSLSVSTTSTVNVTFSNGVIKNGELNLSTSKGVVKLNNITIDNSVSSVTFAGQVELTNVIANDINVTCGSLALKSVKTGESYSYEELTQINNIYTSTDALYESINVDSHSVVGNIYTKNSSKVSVYGTVANVVLEGEGSFIVANEYSNIYAVYVNGKDSLIEYKENANVLTTYVNDNVKNSLITYSDVETESLTSLSVPRFEIHEVKNLCTEVYPKVKYLYTELSGQKFIEIDTVKSHTYDESTIVKKNYLLGEITEYTCTECGSHIREIGEAERSLRSCDNFLDVLLLYIPNFNIDFAVDKEMELSISSEETITINDAYVHIVQNEGSLGGVVSFEGKINGLTQEFKAYINNSKLYLLNVSEESSEVEELENTINKKALEYDLYDYALDLIAPQVEMEKEQLEEMLNQYFGYLTMGIDLCDVALTNVDDVYNLIEDLLTKVFGLIFTDELLEYVDIQKLLFTENDGLYTLDLNNILVYFDKTIETVIDEIYGENTTTDLITLLSETVPNMTLSELTDKIIVFAKANNIDSDKIFKAINAVMNTVNNSTDFDIYSLINDFSDLTLTNIKDKLGNKAPEEVDAILDFVKKDNLENIKETTVYEIYELLLEFAGQEGITYHQMKQVIMMVESYVDFSYKLDENNNITYLFLDYFNATEKQAEQKEEEQESESYTEYDRPEYPVFQLTYSEATTKELTLKLYDSTSELEDKMLTVLDIKGDEVITNVELDCHEFINGFVVEFEYNDSNNVKTGSFTLEKEESFIAQSNYKNDNGVIDANISLNMSYDNEKKEYIAEDLSNIVTLNKNEKGETTVTSDLYGYGDLYFYNLEDVYKLTVSDEVLYKAIVNVNEKDFEVTFDYKLYDDPESVEEIKEKLSQYHFSASKVDEDYSLELVIKEDEKEDYKFSDSIKITRTLSTNEDNETVDEVKLLYTFVDDEDLETSYDIYYNKTTGENVIVNCGYTFTEFKEENRKSVDKLDIFKNSKDEEINSVGFKYHSSQYIRDTKEAEFIESSEYDITNIDVSLIKNECENYVFNYLINTDISFDNNIINISQEVIEETDKTERVNTTLNIFIQSATKTNYVYKDTYYITYNESYDIINNKGVTLFDLNAKYIKNYGITSSKNLYDLTVALIEKDNTPTLNLKYDYQNYAYASNIHYQKDNEEKIIADTLIDDDTYYYNLTSDERSKYTSGDIKYLYCCNQNIIDLYLSKNKTSLGYQYMFVDTNYDNIIADVKDYIVNGNGNYYAKENSIPCVSKFEYASYNEVENKYYFSDINSRNTNYYNEFYGENIPSTDIYFEANYEFDENYILQKLNAVVQEKDYNGAHLDNSYLKNTFRNELVTSFYATLNIANDEDITLDFNMYENETGDYDEYVTSFGEYLNDTTTFNGIAHFDHTQVKINIDKETYEYSLDLYQDISSVEIENYDNSNFLSENNIIDFNNCELIASEYVIEPFRITGDKYSINFTSWCLNSKFSNTDYDDTTSSSYLLVPGYIFRESALDLNLKQENLASVTHYIKYTKVDNVSTIQIHFEKCYDTFYNENVTDADRLYENYDLFFKLTDNSQNESDKDYHLDIYLVTNRITEDICIKDYENVISIVSLDYNDLSDLDLISITDGSLNAISNLIGFSLMESSVKKNGNTYSFYIRYQENYDYNTVNVFNLTLDENEIVFEIPNIVQRSNKAYFSLSGIKLTLTKAENDKTLKLAINNEMMNAGIGLTLDNENVVNFQFDYEYIGNLGLVFNVESDRDLESFEDVFKMNYEDFAKLTKVEESK